MSHTSTNLLIHLIFSTKDRSPLITPDIEPDLHAYLGGIIREIGGSALDQRYAGPRSSPGSAGRKPIRRRRGAAHQNQLLALGARTLAGAPPIRMADRVRSIYGE